MTSEEYRRGWREATEAAVKMLRERADILAPLICGAHEEGVHAGVRIAHKLLEAGKHGSGK